MIILNKEQTKQFLKDINRQPTTKELEFWMQALKDAKEIRIIK